MTMPLRLTIPLILLLFICALATWSLHINGKMAEENVEKESKERLTRILTRLQGSVEQALRRNNLEWAQEEIVGLGNDPNIELGILVDENGKVLASTKIIQIGFMLQDIFPLVTRKESFVPGTLIKKAKSSLAANVLRGLDGKSLFGIVPIQLGSTEGFIRPTRLGMLFAKLNIVDLKATARETVRHQVIQFSLVLGLLTVGLGLFLHYHLTQRIQQLVLAAKAFGRGDFQTHINVGGDDEITILAKSMMEMAEKRMGVEEKLGLSEERFRTIFEEAPLGVALIDSLTGQIYEVNPKFAAISGRTREEMTSIDWMSITHPDDVQIDLDNMADLNAKKIDGFNMDKRYIKPDGSPVWINMTIAPVTVIDKDKPRHLCMIKDITDRKQAEEELEKYRNHLEELVEERTQKLKNSQKQLIHSEKLSSLGKLTGAIAHEFNNPLQGLRNIIEILSNSAPSEKEVKLAELGKSECDRMARMIVSLRDFHKPSSGKSSPININRCLEEVLALQIKSLKERGIQINQQFSDKLPLVEAVEDQIKQVLLNIFQNAADSISGGGQITLTTEAQDSRIIIKIQDTGSGISEDNKKNLFEPFFTTKGTEYGTGLGLSISYGINQNHGGDIEVESELDRGTTFTVILPIRG